MRGPTTSQPQPLHSRAEVAGVLARSANHGSAFLALNEGTSIFSTPSVDGLVAYRRAGRTVFQFGSVVAPHDDRAELLDAFEGFVHGQRRRLCGVQLTAGDARLFAARGYCVNQLGASFTLQLEGYGLGGTRFVRLRNKISRARRAGVTVEDVPVAQERRAEVIARMQELSRRWLRKKGWHVKQLEFMVGDIGEPDHQERRIFAAWQDGALVGFITYVPAYGDHSGYLHDLSRRAPDAPPGVMELINASAIEAFVAEGVGWLTFGFTPFVQMRNEWDDLAGHSRVLHRFAVFCGERLSALYPAKSQEAYKLKWQPSVIEPEYIAFEKRARLADILRLLRMTNAI